MAVNDDKRNKFYLAINHYAEEQRKKIETEIDAYKQKELEDAESEVLLESYRLIQREMAQMRNGIAREMAQREMEARRGLLIKRDEISKKVFERAAEKLAEFSQSAGYPAFLEKSARSLKEAVHGPGTVLLLGEKDKKYEDLVRKAFGEECPVQTDATIRLGGIRAVNSGSGVLADDSLDTRLESQREWFEEHSGMAVI
jgi:V/A-type H+-transporting ATPase subunit E